MSAIRAGVLPQSPQIGSWVTAIERARLAVLAEYPPDVAAILATIPIGTAVNGPPGRSGQWDSHTIWLFRDVFPLHADDVPRLIADTLRHEYDHAMGMWHAESSPSISQPVHWLGGGASVYRRGDSYVILPDPATL